MVSRYVVRLAINVTARRNQVPAYKGRGGTVLYSEKCVFSPVSGRASDFSDAPDQQRQFVYQGQHIQIAFWHGLVGADRPATADTKNAPGAFSIYVYDDPLYKQPLVLATDLRFAPPTAYLIYRDRWPVEQAPLATKQVIGLHRHFVFAPEVCFRLPELGLVAGAILTY